MAAAAPRAGHENHGHQHGHEEAQHDHDERPWYKKYLAAIIVALLIIALLIYAASNPSKPSPAPAFLPPVAKAPTPPADPLVIGSADYVRAQIAGQKAQANDGARVVVLNNNKQKILDSGRDTGTALETASVYEELANDAQQRSISKSEQAASKAKMNRAQAKEDAITACEDNVVCIDKVKALYVQNTVDRVRAMLAVDVPQVQAAPAAPVAPVVAKPKAASSGNASQQSSNAPAAPAASAGQSAGKDVCFKIIGSKGTFTGLGEC